MDTTRRLDNVYYSILEKLSMLQSTIGSLRDLSNQTRDLGIWFDSDANQVKTEIQEQINIFGGFEKQNQRIESLEYRIKQSKERTDSLTQRLGAARERVGALENQEAEVQATITCEFTKQQ
jgi:predicted RNase H-like nuclease (RuvC/YqgF family)